MKSSKSSKSKSKSSGGGRGGGGSSPWSDWIWSPEHGKYYMYCMKNGQPKYHWQETEVSQQPVETIPREQPNVEEITNGFDNLSTSTSTTDGDYSYAPQGEDGTDTSYTYPSSTTSYDNSSRSRKGKETAYESQPHDGEDSPPADPAPPLDPFWGAKQPVSQGYMSDPAAHQDQDFLPPQNSTESMYHEHEVYMAAHDSSATAHSQDSGYGTTDPDDYDHNAILQEALTETYGKDSQDGPSTESAYAYADSEDDGTRTPTGPTPPPSHPMSFAEPSRISGTFGTNEDLDPRYVVEPSHKFRPGSIFKVLWCEPSGTSLGGTPTISDRKPIQDRYGGSLFVGFRRFVVVANDEGHCTCVPILTYQGKACKKKGVKAHKHGMVYHNKPHRPLQNEPELGFAPVRAKLTVDGEKLDKASRVNYSKLVTIEHNVKVFFIGHISPDALDDFADAVDTCWERKTHSHRRSKR
ncbi:hypothetical protein CSUB01_03464 [Colletotrichum sublineola]|uniref:DUF6590 domain-containing protein n=1 Tax=Colletotrichum sublineola TaxID=1173701 RepID=A0A066XRD1_COLSU|nr:hypothetical protein CSUB01_03464 [Colletotrichum sublineola]